ncbi:MAG: hypothetical protein HOP37_11355 [Cyclobacteriaceae bacterium]|nr:hypothetical protein [Cyclobacteriaceae bacterium]
MIFLAVAIGFFAENYREKMAEADQADELAKSLYEELRNDSIQAQAIVAIRLEKEACLKYVQQYFRDSSLTNLPRQFYPCFTKGLYIGTGFFFQPRDGVLHQLISSGALRYFKSVELQQKIGELNVSIANVRSRNDKEYHYHEQYNRQLVLSHYDVDWASAVKKDKGKIADGLEEYLAGNTTIPAVIKNLKQFNREETYTVAFMYLQILEVSRRDDLAKYVKANAELLAAIRKNFPGVV